MNTDEKQAVAIIILAFILTLVVAISIGAFLEFGIIGSLIVFMAFGLMVWGWSNLIG